LRYLADKTRSKEADEKKRKARDAELEAEATSRLKRMKEDSGDKQNWLFNQKLKALEVWNSNTEKGTIELYKKLYGDDWEGMRERDNAKLALAQEASYKQKKELEEWRKGLEKRKEVEITSFRF
jgi:chromatin structure-remodeling complex subunit RSC1/2